MGIFGKISLKNAIKNKENPVKAVKAAGPIVPVKNTKKKNYILDTPQSTEESTDKRESVRG